MNVEELARKLGLRTPTEEQELVAQYPPYVEKGGRKYGAPLLVVAGAGSGKTETLSLRATYMAARYQVPGQNILGLTFTRKAAGELSDRLASRLRQLEDSNGPKDTGNFELGTAPVATTYNAFALGIVQEFGALAGIDPQVAHLDAAASWQLMSEVVASWPHDISGNLAESTIVDRALSLREDIANQALTIDEVRAGLRRLSQRFSDLRDAKKKGLTGFFTEAENVMNQRRELLEIIEEFEELKAATGRMDYSDQVIAAIRIVETLPQVREVLRERHQIVFLDEFQDTSVAQMRFLSNLFRDHPVTAVGDPNQAIYGWRGASAASLMDFHPLFNREKVAPRTTLNLSVAWRNDLSILSAANVIAEPLAKTPSYTRVAGSSETNSVTLPELVSRPHAPLGRSTAQFLLTQEESIQAIVGFVEDARAELDSNVEGRKPSVGVLCRKNAPLRKILLALRSRGIPAQMVGSESLLSHPAVMDLRAALQVTTDPGEAPSLLRLLTNLDLGAADLRALGIRASQIMWEQQERDPNSERSAVLLAEAVDNCAEGGQIPGLSPAATQRVKRLGHTLRQLRDHAALPIAAQVQTARTLLALDLESAADPTSEDVSAVLDIFSDVASEYAGSAPRPTMEAFLEWLKAAELKEQGLALPTVEIDPDAVQVMSIHGSKGLEWDAVAIAEVAAGQLPSQSKGNKTSGGKVSPPPNPGPASGWWKDASILPYPLRQDAAHLPDPNIWDPDMTATSVKALFTEEVGQYRQDEERRLAYVAITRARHRLLLNGSWFSTGKTPRFPSIFMTELVDANEVRESSGQNPPLTEIQIESLPDQGDWEQLSLQEETALFPREPGMIRRRSEQAGARVLEEKLPVEKAGANATLASLTDQRLAADVEALLAQKVREDHDEQNRLKVEPTEILERVGLARPLSVTEIAGFEADPKSVAQDMLRPIPRPPLGGAQLGNHLHRWVENHLRTLASSSDTDLQPQEEIFGPTTAEEMEVMRGMQQAIIDLDILRSYDVHGIEVPFTVTEKNSIVRGRIDAVFKDREGNYLLVDWKTSRRPKETMTEQEKVRHSTQLRYYRKAWEQVAEAEGVGLRSQLVFVSPGGTRTVAEEDIASFPTR